MCAFTVDVPASRPSVWRAEKVQLYFGAVDESAWVWVNGIKVGQHDEGEAGWDKRFGLDVAAAARRDGASSRAGPI